MGVVGVNSDEDRKKFLNISKKKFLNVVKKFFKFTTSSMLIVSYNFEWSDEVRAKREPSSRNEYIK